MMNRFSVAQRGRLRQMFGEWVSFDLEERRIYSHDVAPIPKLIKPILGDATAAAVVQPATEGQLVELVHWANDNKVHLVPRAKATSGYGGVLPVKGGVCVSMNRMRQVLAVDRDTMTARVQPGVVWLDLERALGKEGLALRTYPSSAPSSTVGGWLAQGGVGYGCFEYGRFVDNVVAARVVLPNGEVRGFQGEDLQLISEAEGITGFITEVTLRLREQRPETVRAYRFASSGELAAALNAILAAQLPMWSVSFINPTTASLRNQLPPRLEHGEPVATQRPRLPEDGYIVLLAAPRERWSAAEEMLGKILAQHGAEALDQDLADHEWQKRFGLMHIKRLGPSLLPAEVVVPLERLGEMLAEAESAIRQPLSLEGMVQRDPQDGARGWVTLLGFIPHDERTLAFGVAYALSLTLVRIAKKYGGRPYATGLYFSSQAEAILGPERVQRLRAFKREVDGQGVMNPRKVIDSGLMGHLIGALLPIEPLARIPANLASSPVGERFARQGKRGVPADIAWYAYACAQCGYCVDECDQYYGRGWESESPRGRWFFLRDYLEGRAQMTQAWVENFLACTTCEMCDVKCPLELPNHSSWMRMRGELVGNQDRLTLPPFELMRASTEKEFNIWGSYKEDRPGWVPKDLPGQVRENGQGIRFGGCSAGPTRDRTAWLPDEVKEKLRPEAEIAYFAGCTASLVEKDIAEGTARLLCAAGVDFTYLGEEEACCGIPALCAGTWDTFETILRHNVEAMQQRGVSTVVTSCPACWLAWHTYYPQWTRKLGIPFHIKARHYSEVLAERLKSGELKFTHQVPRQLTWHDSCHMGRAGGIYEPPRELLRAIPGVELREMEYNREEAHCCGGVLSLLESPEQAAVKIGGLRLEEARATGAEALVAACPCCEVQFRVTAQKTGNPLPIVDLAHVAAEGLGISLPDPTGHMLEQWATFEAMIKLLKPEAMADFMADLLPAMIEAMPQPFRGVMHWTREASPGMRNALWATMEPLLPVLFPRLLPGMLPRLMPDMLAAMERVVPMPDTMKEQMPDLMPTVMGRLLPKMLPEVVPYFVPRMAAYMKHEGLPKAA